MALTIELAQKIITRAIEAGRDQNLPIVVVVTDGAGDIVAAMRMDGVHAINTDVARRKALTAAAFRAATHDIVSMVSRDDLARAALLNDSRLNILPGGMPILVDDVVVGGLGIAGGYYMQDRAIAEYAMAAS